MVDMSKEIWVDIQGYEGIYQVSNYGNVRSLDRISWNGVNHFLLRGKVLSPGYSSSGYLQVILRKDNKNHQAFVHRLVAQAFLDDYSESLEVNHLDENPDNNRADNLSMVTHKENINYGSCIERSAKNHAKKVHQYDLEGNLLHTYNSTPEAIKVLGKGNSSAISACCRGRQKTAYGYVWKYVD